MNVSETDFKYMREFIIRDMAYFLTQDFNMTMEQALRAVYNSHTLTVLDNAETGFYYQSPRYVYNYLKDELVNGKFNPHPRFS